MGRLSLRLISRAQARRPPSYSRQARPGMPQPAHIHCGRCLVRPGPKTCVAFRSCTARGCIPVSLHLEPLPLPHTLSGGLEEDRGRDVSFWGPLPILSFCMVNLSTRCSLYSVSRSRYKDWSWLPLFLLFSCSLRRSAARLRYAVVCNSSVHSLALSQGYQIL